MKTELAVPLRRLVNDQSGVVSRGQLLRAGLTDSFVRAQVSAGRWQRRYSGVYLTYSGRPDRQSMIWAGLLYAGDRAITSYQTAAELWG